MATFYSEQVTKLNTVPADMINVDELHGKVRIAKFDYAQVAEGAADSIIQLVKLPAGRIRLLGKESALYHNLTTGAVDLDIGWAAYTNFSGTAVVADADGLDDNVDCETAGIIRIGTVAAVLAVCGNKVFESQEGVIITATIKTAVIAATDVLRGYIAYVLD